MTCPALPIGGNETLTGALTAIDCQLNAAVAGAYGRLFASGGALSLALTSLLTIYIAILAFGLLTGRTRLTLPALAPKAVAIALVLTLATSWQAYHIVIHTLLSGGPDQIASIVLGAREGATHAFAGTVDGLFNGVLEASNAVANASQGGAGDGEAPGAENITGLMWFSALELLLSTVGLLVVSRILLAILLGLGPVFIVLALFASTRGLFEAWLRTTLAFAFAPMLIVLGGGAVLAALEPIIAAIVADPAGAVATQRPIVVLFIGVNVYAVLVLAAAWTAFSLTQGWKTDRRELPTGEGGRLGATTRSPSLAASPASPAAVVQDRAGGLATMLMREQLSASTTVASLHSAAANDSAPRAVRRRSGLGKTFRKTST